MDGTLIPDVTKLFWGDDLQELSWEKHQRYITQTILEQGNEVAVEWLLSLTPSHTLGAQLPTLRLSEKTHQFWSSVL